MGSEGATLATIPASRDSTETACRNRLRADLVRRLTWCIRGPSPGNFSRDWTTLRGPDLAKRFFGNGGSRMLDVFVTGNRGHASGAISLHLDGRGGWNIQPSVNRFPSRSPQRQPFKFAHQAANPFHAN